LVKITPDTADFAAAGSTPYVLEAAKDEKRDAALILKSGSFIGGMIVWCKFFTTPADRDAKVRQSQFLA